MSHNPKDPAQPDYSSYIAGWKQRQQREKAAIEKRRAHARQIATKATEILKEHGATSQRFFAFLQTVSENIE